MLGPIDYIVVGFTGNNFDGSILEALKKAVDREIIRVVDLVFIIKDKDGGVIEGEFEDQSEDIQQMFKDMNYSEDTGMPLLSDADIAKLGEQMPPTTAAGVLVVEQLWAKDLKQALLNAGGFLIADGRIHSDAVEAAMQELEKAKQ